MLQATASLMAEARAEEQNRLLQNGNTTIAEPETLAVPVKKGHRRFGGGSSYTLTARLFNRICSDSCLKFVYLSCATLVSASFIIQCILLHLIVVPYLSESAFEAGVCQFSGSRAEANKRCENKCSKERSSFPCLQIRVMFSPLIPDNGMAISGTRYANVSGDGSVVPYADLPGNGGCERDYFSHMWARNVKRYLPENTTYDFNAPDSRILYLYDYFSTFTAHKKTRCATSPCHRREEDNKLAVEEFKRELWKRHIFLCYARPFKFGTKDFNSKTVLNDTAVQILSNRSLGGRIQLRRIRDSQNAAAILHRLYSPTMFFHSLCWPSSLFLGGLIVLLFTYLVDGCQAWAGDKTVIA
ncbi:unnamed protein product [Calicophoron daubneyi]|uniref:Uncharacterized protein n=1 Tax=Calicophoron daubneyi TaxID=300641 RepID=A0AAV2TBV6_CALDB